jgi:hypothetical protein
MELTMLSQQLKESLELIIEKKIDARSLPPDLLKALITWLIPMSYPNYQKTTARITPRSIGRQNAEFQRSAKDFGPKWQVIADRQQLYGFWNNGAGDYYAYSFRDGYVWRANHETWKLERVSNYKQWMNDIKGRFY